MLLESDTGRRALESHSVFIHTHTHTHTHIYRGRERERERERESLGKGQENKHLKDQAVVRTLPLPPFYSTESRPNFFLGYSFSVFPLQ